MKLIDLLSTFSGSMQIVIWDGDLDVELFRGEYGYDGLNLNNKVLSINVLLKKVFQIQQIHSDENKKDIFYITIRNQLED